MNELVLCLSKIAAMVLAMVYATQVRTAVTCYVLLALLAIVHYALAWYSERRAIGRLLTTPRGRIGLSATLLLALGLIWFRPISILQYFIVHNAFNEVYYWNQKARLPQNGVLSFFRVMFHIALLFLCSQESYFQIPTNFSFPIWPWILGCIGWLGVGILLSVKLGHRMPPQTMIAFLLFDLLSLVMVDTALYTGHPLRSYDIIVYHSLFWTFAPLSLAPEVRRFSISWLALIVPVFFFGIFWLPGVRPFLSARGQPPGFRIAEQIVTIGAFLHISTSFMLSHYHPSFIASTARWFKPVARAGGLGTETAL